MFSHICPSLWLMSATVTVCVCAGVCFIKNVISLGEGQKAEWICLSASSYTFSLFDGNQIIHANAREHTHIHFSPICCSEMSHRHIFYEGNVLRCGVKRFSQQICLGKTFLWGCSLFFFSSFFSVTFAQLLVCETTLGVRHLPLLFYFVSNHYCASWLITVIPQV